MPPISSEPPDVTTSTATDEVTTETVEHLVGELEDFAFERERVLAKLDIRAAATARRIGRELRVMLRGLPMATDEAAKGEVHATLGSLLEEAHRSLWLKEEEPASLSSRPPGSEVPVGGRAPEGEEREEAPLESGERPVAPDSERQFTEEDARLFQEEEQTIARKVTWDGTSNRILRR